MTKVALPGSQVLVLPKKKKKFIFFLFTKPFGMGVTQPTYASYLRNPKPTHTHTHMYFLAHRLYLLMRVHWQWLSNAKPCLCLWIA